MSDPLDMYYNQWYHIAVSVSRSTDRVTFYVNGQHLKTVLGAASVTGTLCGTGYKYPKMDIGHGYPAYHGDYSTVAYNYTDYYFSGKIDEVQIYKRALEAHEIEQIYNAAWIGKCKDHCYVPSVTTFDINKTEIDIDVTICNKSNYDIVYHLDAWGDMPPTGNCNYNWPPSTPGNHIHCADIPLIKAGDCDDITLTIPLPPGFGSGDIACYCARFYDPDTWEFTMCCGTIVGTNKKSASPINGIVSMTIYDSLEIPFIVRNIGDSTNLFDYVISTHSGYCGDSLSSIVSLNGLPPGEDVTGSISIPLNDSAIVTVQAELTGFVPWVFEEVVLLSDLDGDLVMEPLAVSAIRPITFPDCNANGVDDSLDIATGTSLDSNSNNYPDECESYDDTTSRSLWELLVVMIEKTHNTLQGQHEYVSVTLEFGIYEMGGFDFLIAYDASALTFTEATPGQLLEDCDWEYFTYRYGPFGNCGDACPSGLLRIIAIAETNNGPYHPSCFLPDSLPATLFTLDFLVTDDRTFECTYVPIRFFWMDCGDNAISSKDGDILYIDRKIYDFEGNLIWDEEDDDVYPEADRIPWVGAPDYCLNPDPDKPSPIRFIDFVFGGIDIVCAESLDARGDINLNGVSNEVADAVLFSNYFIYGLGVFHINFDGQVAATDVNADGMVLTVGDLVYQIRIIVGDAPPYPKLAPVTADYNVEDGIVSVDAEMGAAYVVAEGDVTPTLLADNMEMKYAYDADEDVTRILVYSMEKGQTFAGAFLDVEGKVVSIEMATYEGAPVTSTLLPTEFALHQNYPNPFNPITTISFALPVATDYELAIYNVMGQEVVTFSGHSEPGIVKVDWDASDYASGVYLYKLTAGNFTDTKKMVLLK